MLNQLDIYLRNTDISERYSDLGIKLHGFVMTNINKNYAILLHTQEPRPFSLFVYDSGDGFVTPTSSRRFKSFSALTMIFISMSKQTQKHKIMLLNLTTCSKNWSGNPSTFKVSAGFRFDFILVKICLRTITAFRLSFHAPYRRLVNRRSRR